MKYAWLIGVIVFLVIAGLAARGFNRVARGEFDRKKAKRESGEK